MLIATLSTLFVLLFVGGSGSGADEAAIQATFHQIEPLLQEVVQDPARRESATAVAKQLNTGLEAFFAAMKKDQEMLLQVDKNHASTEEDFWKVFNQGTATWSRFERRLIELRFDLKEHLTREEWAALFKGLKKTVQ